MKKALLAKRTGRCSRGPTLYRGGRPRGAQRRQEDGTHWLPAEVDVSIRPGWYYHEAEDSLVRTVPQLLDIYYTSVGRNASMLLNVPPDKTGRIPGRRFPPADGVRPALAAEFSKDLAADARVSASNVRGHSGKYGAMRVTDGDTATYWATDDDVRNASLTVMFDQPTVFNRLLVQSTFRWVSGCGSSGSKR